MCAGPGTSNEPWEAPEQWDVPEHIRGDLPSRSFDGIPLLGKQAGGQWQVGGKQEEPFAGQWQLERQEEQAAGQWRLGKQEQAAGLWQQQQQQRLPGPPPVRGGAGGGVAVGGGSGGGLSQYEDWVGPAAGMGPLPLGPPPTVGMAAASGMGVAALPGAPPPRQRVGVTVSPTGVQPAAPLDAPTLPPVRKTLEELEAERKAKVCGGDVLFGDVQFVYGCMYVCYGNSFVGG